MSYSRSPRGQKAFSATSHSEAGYQLERKRIQTENAQKTERLKALRLAKEAAERLEAANNPVVAKKRRLRKVAVPDVASP